MVRYLAVWELLASESHTPTSCALIVMCALMHAPSTCASMCLIFVRIFSRLVEAWRRMGGNKGRKSSQMAIFRPFLALLRPSSARMKARGRFRSTTTNVRDRLAEHRTVDAIGQGERAWLFGHSKSYPDRPVGRLGNPIHAAHDRFVVTFLYRYNHPHIMLGELPLRY